MRAPRICCLVRQTVLTNGQPSGTELCLPLRFVAAAQHDHVLPWLIYSILLPMPRRAFDSHTRTRLPLALVLTQVLEMLMTTQAVGHV